MLGFNKSTVGHAMQTYLIPVSSVWISWNILSIRNLHTQLGQKVPCEIVTVLRSRDTNTNCVDPVVFEHSVFCAWEIYALENAVSCTAVYGPYKP